MHTLVGRISPLKQRGLVRPAYVDPSLTTAFSRNSTATYTAPNGTVTEAAVNVLRRTNSQYVSTNYLPNPWAMGFSQSSDPTGWTMVGNAPFVLTRVGSGVEDGIPYVDFRLVGIHTTTLQHGVFFNTNTDVAVTQGQTATFSLHIRQIAGSMRGITGLWLNLTAQNGNTGLGGNFQRIETQEITNAPLRTQRKFKTVTYTDPATAGTRSSFLIDTTSGLAVDITLRVGGPMIEPGAVLNQLVLPSPGSFGPAQLWTGDRMLIERNVVNLITNPRAEGTTTQTQPTGPGSAVNTTWQVVNHSSGLALDLSPITYLGMTGVRARYYGTSVASPGPENMEFEVRNAIAATASTAYTGTVLRRLYAGTIPAGVSEGVRFVTFETTKTTVVDNISSYSTVTLDSRVRRVSQVLTIGATAAWINFGNSLSIPANTVCDFTIEYFYPQIKAGNIADSEMLPTPGVLAASTRQQDIAAIPIAAWYKARPFSMVFSAKRSFQTTDTGNGLFALDDGTFNNRLYCFNGQNSNDMYIQSAVAGVYNGPFIFGTYTLDTPFKFALMCDGTNIRVSMNGAAVASYAVPFTLTSPTSLVIGSFGPGAATGNAWNGEIGAAEYYPYPLNDAQLRAAST